MPEDTNPVTRRSLLRATAAGVVGVGSLRAAAPATAAPGSYTTESYNGRTYTKYVPTGADGSTPIPLVVMLHGCTQSPDQFKDATLMNEVAESETFVVIYPEQTTSAHVNRCWQWWADSHTTRGNGEAALIAGMVGDVKGDDAIDDERVYAAGFSAGAAMVPNLVAAYPDVFAASGVHSGLEYDAADSEMGGTLAMTQGGPDPQGQGTSAYNAMAANGVTSPVPTVVFHGSSDYTVYPVNGDQAAEQATQTIDLALDGSDDDDVDYTADATETGSGDSLSYTRYDYADGDGTVWVERWMVDGMGHAWSGGAQGGSYTAPGGPDASHHVWDFFSRFTLAGPDDGGGGGGGNTAPTASAAASPTDPEIDETVSFDGTGSSDPDGSIQSYDWDFGDGSTATGATPTHSYGSAGEYSATLTVTDDESATDTDSVTITVGDGGFQGYCGTDDNYSHVQAGRAYTSGGYAYAVGSDDQLGLYNTFYTSTLKETSPGYFEEVNSC